ncbi:competence protein [Flavobacterium sp.]|uniref:competence protein n=1 Tax=Flavobacterium sp. TaxID=239 RepID=UPI00260DEF93|nr:competence protein [Flavobacterium sp.]
MSFENIKESAEEIQEKVKDVLDSNVAYYKLWLFKVATKSATVLLKMLLSAFFLVMFLFFSSIALALFLGKQFENNMLGFLAVGGMYLVLMFIVYFLKEKIVESTILEKFSRIFFND